MTTQYTIQNIDPPQLETLPSDTTIGETLEHMFRNRTGPVGIMNDEQIIGVVTYQSVARALLIVDRLNQADSLRDLPVETAINRSFPRVTPTDELFELFDVLADSPFVIVTSTDDSPRLIRDVEFHQFLQQELEEFLLIEEIERNLRDLLRAEFGTELSDALQETFEQLDDLRTPDSLDHCSFRHYSIFISDHWAAVDHRFDHNPDFIRELINRVGDIRNQLFHFRGGDTAPDLDSEVLEFAREHFQYVHSQSTTYTHGS